MDIQNELNAYLADYVKTNNTKPVYAEFNNPGLTILQLRDRLLLTGSVLKEDLDKQVYVINPNGFVPAFSQAVVIIKLTEEKICCLSYAREGLIRQNTAQKSLDAIKQAVLSGKVIKRKKAFIPIILVGVAAAGTMMGIALSKSSVSEAAPAEPEHEIVSFPESQPEEGKEEITLADQYHNAIVNYNTLADAYNEKAKLLDLKNLQDMPEKVAKKTEAANVTEAMVNDTIEDLTALLAEFSIIENLTMPEEDWIITRLKDVESISEVSPVTEDHDPDGLLGKEDSYYSCIYFSVDSIDQKDIPGETLIDKGTDAGGAVELYDTVEKARTRCEYLGQFDNTLLYTGSYTILGTMVIRTSYALSNESQMELTRQIVDSIIS